MQNAPDCQQRGVARWVVVSENTRSSTKRRRERLGRRCARPGMRRGEKSRSDATQWVVVVGAGRWVRVLVLVLQGKRSRSRALLLWLSRRTRGRCGQRVSRWAGEEPVDRRAAAAWER